VFQLIRSISRLDLAVRQLPVLLVSFVTATLFYEFGNFGLEMGAFLGTWFVLDAVVQAGLAVLHRDHQALSPHA
jgi:hypothetical protein